VTPGAADGAEPARRLPVRRGGACTPSPRPTGRSLHTVSPSDGAEPAPLCPRRSNPPGVTLYDRVADLPLTVDGFDLERAERDTTSGFTRVTTTVALRGPAVVGRGEDVTYDAEDHDALAVAPPALPTGEFTFASYAAALDDVELFAEPPDSEAAHQYRRWAVESAALDLALRQAGESLGSVLGRSYDPVRFVASTRLGEAGFGRIEELLDANPDLAFKLDPTDEWDEALVGRLAETGRVRVLDLKGYYEGTDVDTEPDADLYELVLSGFPDAVVEDARFTDETRPVLAGHEDRLSWDYPVTGVESVADLPVEPEWLNVKPSRFGTVESLLSFLEYCEDEGIRLYGGGQFELGVGRRHVQVLASLFYPDAPNDVAPSAYNDPESEGALPRSPLVFDGSHVGFGGR
jgi:hypothetical protein